MTPAILPDMTQHLQTAQTSPNADPLSLMQGPPLTPFQQLSDAAIAYLPDMLKACLDEDRSSRREEVRTAWELRLFAKGRQQLFYDTRNYVFYALAPENVSFRLPTHRAVFDITSPHKRSFVSVLSENPPGINFVANDGSKGKDSSAAAAAEKKRADVDRLVAMKRKQAQVAGRLCTDGRVIAWTRVNEAGKLDVSLWGVLESKCAIYENEDDTSTWDYCVLSREGSLWKARHANPEYADDISSGNDNASADTSYERYARLGVLARKSSAESSFRSLVTEHWCFVSPWRYLKAPDDVKDELKQLFPDGIRLHAYGSTVVDAQPDDLSQLAVEYPVDDDGTQRPALLNGMPYIQRAYNDFRNQQRDAADYSVPRTWMDSEAIDGEAIEEQETAYGVVSLMTPRQGKPVGDSFFIEPQVQAPAAWDAMLQGLKADGENLTGDFPSLYGGDTPGQDTVGVNRLLNNQAKGQLGPAWASVQRLFGKIYEIAVPLQAQIDLEAGDTSAQAVLDGQFHCHPDKDSSFPETTADKRASFAQLSQDIASMGDAGTMILGQPDNLKLRVQFAGVPDFFIPGAEARDKALRLIEQCLDEPPVPNTNDPQWQQAAGMAQMQGQPIPPPPMQCSVQIDPEWDYLQPMADKVQQWLSSPAEYEAQREGNTQGLQNVKLLGRQIRDAIAAQQANQKPQGPPMGISAKFETLDPATQIQALQRDGYQPSEGFYEGRALQAAQTTAAETQDTAANAQHHAVLAAREAVKPHIMPKPAQTPQKSQTPSESKL